MKSDRWVHILLAFVLICCLVNRADAVVTLNVEGGIGIPGRTVQVRVTADDAPSIAGAAFTITYDTGHLSLQSIQDSSFFDVFSRGPEIAGTGVRICGARRSPGVSQTTLLILNFLVKTDAESASGYVTGGYPIDIVESTVLDPPAGYGDPMTIPILTGLEPAEDPLKNPDRAFPARVAYVQAAMVYIDRDADGLTDLEEGVLGTDPDEPDSDHDGLPDGWEVLKGLNPKEAADAFSDKDWDGFSNLREFLSGTDPNDFQDTPPGVISDMDGDGDVDGMDLAAFSSGLTGLACVEGAPCKWDLDRDGDVDESDLFLAAEEYGRR